MVDHIMYLVINAMYHMDRTYICRIVCHLYKPSTPVVSDHSQVSHFWVAYRCLCKDALILGPNKEKF